MDCWVRLEYIQGVSLRNLSKKTGMTALHVAAYFGEEGEYF
jgi:ankyrin repeat protein